MRTATERAAGAAAARPAAWFGHAFGIGLRSELPIDGVEPSPESPVEGPPTALQLSDAADLQPGWEGAERLSEWRLDDGTHEGALDRRPDLGYRLSVRGYGTYVVSPDGLSIRCAPPPAEERWRWQRALVGQILPLAAVLRGVEVLHASAVSLRGCAFAVAGASTAGKTSVAVNLVLRGAGFLADDVVAIRDAPEGLIVYPGAGLTSVRRVEAEAIGTAGLARLGPVLGDDGEALRVRVERDDRPRPLAALYFLDHSGGGTAAIEALDRADPRLLLGSSFSVAVNAPERQRRRLDICAQLAAGVPQRRVRVAPGTTAAQVAELVERDASAVAAGTRT